MRRLLILSLLPILLSTDAASRQCVPSHHFGVHAVGDNFQGVKQLGATTARHMAVWQKLEPSPGKIAFAAMDKFVEQAGDAGVDTLVSFRCTSKWGCIGVRNDNGQREYDQPETMPKRMSDWTSMLARVVERYDGDGINDMPGLRVPIKNWQIGNEFIPQWKGTDDEFFQLLQVSYQTIKAADPQATVVAPGLTGCNYYALYEGIGPATATYHGSTDATCRRITIADMRRMNKQRARAAYSRAKGLFEKAGDYFDVADVHIYFTDIDGIYSSVNWIKKQLQQNGLTKRIWSLEFAGPFHKFSDREFCNDIVKGQCAGFAAGLDRIYWSSFYPTPQWSENYLRLSLLDSRNQPKQAASVYHQLAKVLGNFQAVQNISNGQNELYEFSLADGQRALVGWSADRNGKCPLNVDGNLYQSSFLRPDKQPLTAEKGHPVAVLSATPVFIVSQAQMRVQSRLGQQQ